MLEKQCLGFDSLWSNDLLKGYESHHVRESRFRNLGNSGILGFGIRNAAQGFQNPTNDWNPESKTVLDFLTWGDTSQQ